MTTADQSPIDSGLLEALAEIRERVGSNEESPILKVMRAHPEYSLEDVVQNVDPLDYALGERHPRCGWLHFR